MILLEAVKMIKRLNVFPVRGILKNVQKLLGSFFAQWVIVPVNSRNQTGAIYVILQQRLNRQFCLAVENSNHTGYGVKS